MLIRSDLKIAVKAATAGALEAADLEQIAKGIGAEVSSIEDKYIGELLIRPQKERERIIAEKP